LDDVVATAETEKVTVEIRSDLSGKITQVFAKEQEQVQVGAKFLEIDVDSKGESSAPAQKPKVFYHLI